MVFDRAENSSPVHLFDNPSFIRQIIKPVHFDQIYFTKRTEASKERAQKLDFVTFLSFGDIEQRNLLLV